MELPNNALVPEKKGERLTIISQFEQFSLCMNWIIYYYINIKKYLRSREYYIADLDSWA